MATEMKVKTGLTKSEAIKKGGPFKWHPFGKDLQFYSTVVEGERLVVEKAVFHQMKAEKKATEAG